MYLHYKGGIRGQNMILIHTWTHGDHLSTQGILRHLFQNVLKFYSANFTHKTVS